ncbi:MAG TPA: helix-turn-helix domain-containing protein [Methylocystis sp.]|uniref:MerR family transcriptional regulator n=1 Tax=Methylosinus sp. LW3 TaxID=107635 RepID=UPI000463CF52|nr:helix-turn-helix domain-containing protein [Methylosinus sp. LW3]
MKAEERFSIGELSKQSDVNIETIRYYEKIGVMPAPGRSAGGYRIYGADHLKRLSFVRRSRQLGFSLDEIRGLLRLVDGHAYTCAEVQALTLNHVAEIRRKIADLKRLERVMAEMAAQCSGERAPECAVINALFDAWPPSNERHANLSPPKRVRSATSA